jgi:hypothetical protein
MQCGNSKALHIYCSTLSGGDFSENACFLVSAAHYHLDAHWSQKSQIFLTCSSTVPFTTRSMPDSLKLRVYVLLGVLFIRNNCGMALKVIIL